MRILYGVQATGNGHISRARAFAQAFANHPDIEVDWVFSGRSRDALFEMEPFGNFACYRGLSFVTRQGRINPLATAREANLHQLWQDVRLQRPERYDIVLSDFEPITAWAARQRGIPSIAISHQAAFLHDIPKPSGTLWHHGIMQYFAPTEVALGVHWHHFGQPILPPVLEPLPQVSQPDDFVLVYLPFEELQTIQALLQPLKNQRFICYHPGISQAQHSGNLRWLPPSRHGFLQDLVRCNGVIANAGFELPSEALALGKSLLVRPLEGQFEQQANALALDQLGYAQTMTQLETGQIAQWLEQPALPAMAWADVPEAVIQWLKQGNWQSVDSLVQQLWSGSTIHARLRAA